MKIVITILIMMSSSPLLAEKQTRPLETVTLQLMWKHQFEFAGFYAAVEQGYYQAVGLDVKIKAYSPQLDLAEEVVSGRAQYGIDDSSLLIKRSLGLPVVLLANIFQHSPMVLLSLAQSKIYSPAQMIGKTLMMSKHEKHNASIIAMLNAESVSMKQLHIVPHSTDINDLITGKVDVTTAYATNEPGVLKARGIKFNIIDPINYGIDFYGNNIFTSETYLHQHPQQVKDFIQASLKGWQYALKHPDEIIDLILAKYSTEKSRSALSFEASHLPRFILPDHIPLGQIDLSRMQRIVAVYQQLNMLPTDFSLDGFIYQEQLKTQQVIELTAQEQAWIKQHPTITIGVDPVWAPFEFIDKTGQYAGMVADYIQLISKKTGLQFVVQNHFAWVDVLQSARDGQLDLLPAVMMSDQRRSYLNFSSPYIKYPMVIVSRQNSPFVGDLSGLSHQQVAVVKGYVSEDILRINHPEIVIKPVQDIQQALKMLAGGEVVALVDNLATVSHYITQLGISNLRVSGTTPYSFELAFATPKSKAGQTLLSIIEKVLFSLTREEKKMIERHWISIHYTPSVNYFRALLIGFILLLFGLLVLFWNRQLVKEVLARKAAEQELSKNQAILQCKNKMLQLLSQGLPLKTLLIHLMEQLEQIHSPMIGSILLLDQKTKCLHHGYSVRLPKFFVEAIDGVTIGEGVGSCGTAAYLGQRVIVEDIINHPYWQDYKLLAQSANLAACWSEPVLSSSGQVLGTFAIYYHQPKKPTKAELALIHEFAVLTTLIIERYRSHERLKKLSLAVEQSANVVIITDNQGIIEYTNPKFTEVTGYSQEEAIGQTPRLIKSGKMSRSVYQNLWQTLLSGNKWQGEFCNRKKNGQIYWAWDNISPIMDDSQQVTHFVAIQEDITDRKYTQETLQRRESQFRNLVENLNIIAWEMEMENFLFTYVSPQAEKILGYPLDEWKKPNFWLDHLVDEDRSGSLQYRLAKITQNRDHAFDYRMVKANGEIIWFRDIVTICHNATEQTNKIYGILIDITERKQYESLLNREKHDAEQASKLKSEFLATMTHELRTPMNGILGMAQLLKQTSLNAEQLENVNIILDSGQILLDIINEILDLSKLEAKQLKLEYRVFDLKLLAQKILSLFTADIRHKKIRIYLDYSPDCPRYWLADDLRIQQILINLVGNAVKFTEHGQVCLRISADTPDNGQTKLYLAVEDTGIGILSGNILHLFEPFVQADQSMTRRFGGTGLGLAVCKQLVDLMKGRIEVQSTLGQGSIFQVSLPLSLANKDKLPVSHPVVAWHLPDEKRLNTRILLVEDDQINQKVVTKMLTEIGVKIERVEHGEHAVESCRKNRFDLILMDCHLPVMDGYQATRQIRQLPYGNKVPIIALTANASDEGRQNCFDAGMNDILTKPLKIKCLFDCLNGWLSLDFGKEQNKAIMVTDRESCGKDNFKALLDQDKLAQFRLEMGEDFAEIWAGIMTGFDDFLQQYQGDLSDLSKQQMSRLAHNLKSRALHIGAPDLSRLAGEIEQFAKQKNWQQAMVVVKQLGQMYSAIKCELKGMRI